MRRSSNLILSLLLLPILLLPIFFISLVIFISSGMPILYWSERLGKDSALFSMPKFRTMLTDTPPVATHLLDNPNAYLLPFSGFLRRYSLDELPQLFSVLKGDMSFVGPRPALFNQDDLVNLRSEKGVDKLLPGITGWAQVNGRDELSIPDKVNLDTDYLNSQSFWFDIKILWMTFLKVAKRDGVSH